MKYHWIEQRLEQLGYTKKDLAQALSLPPSRVSEILKNKRQVKLSELPSLATTLQLSQSDLLSQLLNTPPPIATNKKRTSPAPVQDIWVIGRRSRQQPGNVSFWPTAQHYLIRLPLPLLAHQEDLHYLALEHRTIDGILDQLYIHSQEPGVPLPTNPSDFQSPALFHLNLSSPLLE